MVILSLHIFELSQKDSKKCEGVLHEQKKVSLLASTSSEQKDVNIVLCYSPADTFQHHGHSVQTD